MPVPSRVNAMIRNASEQASFSPGVVEMSHAGKLFTSIAVQLAGKSPSLERYICGAIAEHSDIGSQALRDQWHQLILELLSKLDSDFSHQPLIIVVDALDECDDENDIRAILELFTEVRSLRKVQLRVFMPRTTRFLSWFHVT